MLLWCLSHNVVFNNTKMAAPVEKCGKDVPTFNKGCTIGLHLAGTTTHEMSQGMDVNTLTALYDCSVWKSLVNHHFLTAVGINNSMIRLTLLEFLVKCNRRWSLSLLIEQFLCIPLVLNWNRCVCRVGLLLKSYKYVSFTYWKICCTLQNNISVKPLNNGNVWCGLIIWCSLYSRMMNASV